HGLYLSINGLLLFIAFLIMKKLGVREGTYTAVFLLWYGAVRFVLDFFRATEGTVADARYLGLTPAQYAAIVMFSLGIYVLVRPKKQKLPDLAA
ncbi:MAG: prolipoprotein diacylglyceryl transferase family protein, partial [Candidatus Uhrbacteria bacterium]